ncbi:phage terminase large subunit family protein [Ferrimonas balearica]|uniref:phage terminase large subunit family protein n=1 Tax=Ferrimonas balearica TaxID=44012 RepID=UPI001C99FD8B|nr:terminase gpA endonuclease subunit [Ferrimonas balearica]MBY5992507.1 phage terminase large subunit family protein [Ferrimonas balearica]
MTASEWADENYYLSAESTYLEGRWKTLCWQVAILNAMGNDSIDVVNLVKSARVGYTQMIKAACAYMVASKQRNQMILQPTDGAADDFMKSHVDTMIRDVPAVRTLSPWYGKKHPDNTLNAKKFSNRRQLWCLGGATAKNYREKSLDTIVYDELAAFAPDVEKEGSPTFLGDKRLEGSVFRKSIRGSTPKVRGECQIERAASESGMVLRYWVPCPHCGEHQALKWGGKDADHGIKWEDGEPDTAAYLCEHCGALGSYAQWIPLFKEGYWLDDKANVRTVDGIDWFTRELEPIKAPLAVTFHIWTAYSSFTSWTRIVQEWTNCRGDLGKLKTFVNTTLGESWQEEGERIDSNDLYRRREHYEAEVPAGAVVLTCSVDTQDDRLEAEVRAWGEGFESWAVDFRVFRGDPGRPELWNQLDSFLLGQYEHSSGAKLPINCTVIDSGGHFTQQVYDFVKPREGRRVFAIKGLGGSGKPIISRPSRANKGRVNLFSIGVDTAKELVTARMKILEPGPGYCHWPVSEKFDIEFFEQLAAEERRTRYIKGRPVQEWHQVRKRNEAFDLSVYNTAAVMILDPDFQSIRESLSPESEEKQRSEPAFAMKLTGF